MLLVNKLVHLLQVHTSGVPKTGYSVPMSAKRIGPHSEKLDKLALIQNVVSNSTIKCPNFH